MSKIKQYFINQGIHFSQGLNVRFGGSPDETLSSRLGRNYPSSLLARLVNKLFFWQENHVKEAIEPEDRAKDAVIK
jgi:hypothetical protein